MSKSMIKVECQDCGYQDDAEEFKYYDAPARFCPKCGSSNVIPLYLYRSNQEGAKK